MIKDLNQYFTDIYFHLHPSYEEIISHQSIRILQFIQKSKDVMVGDIAESLNVSPNTASEHVKRLAGSGWIRKERTAEDQRRVYLSLTEEGLAVVKKNTELDEKKLQKALDKLSADEQAMIFKAFLTLSEVSK